MHLVGSIIRKKSDLHCLTDVHELKNLKTNTNTSVRHIYKVWQIQLKGKKGIININHIQYIMLKVKDALLHKHLQKESEGCTWRLWLLNAWQPIHKHQPVKMQKSCPFHAHHNMAGTDIEAECMVVNSPWLGDRIILPRSFQVSMKRPVKV